jgi:hypothetical protein
MIHLCQRARASCGACCGLYNRTDQQDRGAATAELWRRTRRLARAERTEAAFRQAAAELSAGGPAPLFPSVKICPLLGFLDAAGTRVGCLAHPLTTGGLDLRQCGTYDVTTCESFLCPSHAFLDEGEAQLAEAVGDWYLYGLVVTDTPFLRAVLAAVAVLTGEEIALRHLDHPPFRRALVALLEVKELLEPGSDGLFAAFRPGRSGEPVPRRSDYEEAARAGAPHEVILTCLGADPRSGNDLEALEGEVRRRLDACAAAFGPSPRAGGRR